MKKQSAGFTLIELLVVMMMVSVLSAISFVSFQGAQKASRDGRRKADIEQIRSALEMYRNDCKQYPAAVTFGGSLTGAEAVCLGTTFMAGVPNDPQASAYAYIYKRSSPSAYVLCSFLETNSSTAYDATCGGNCGSHCYYLQANP